MSTIEQRYTAAQAYITRAVAVVENGPPTFDPLTGGIEWYAGRKKTESTRAEFERVEARWLRATSDADRARIARDAELLADRVQEDLPGAPQDRIRTNLFKGETQSATPATSYTQEADRQGDEVWHWIKDKTDSLADVGKGFGKWILIGGGLLVGARLLLSQRERQRQAAASSARVLNRALEREADSTDARNAGRLGQKLAAVPLHVHFGDTELCTWFERDRAYVELYDRRTGKAIVQWRDGEVRQAVADGVLPSFSNWTHAAVHQAAFEYAKRIGALAEPRDAGVERARAPWLVLGAGAAAVLLLVARGRSQKGAASLLSASTSGSAVSDDAEALARVITSEANGYSEKERTAIAWTVRNRAHKRGVSIARLVCWPTCGPCCQGRPFSSARPATTQNLALARLVLAAPASEDPTRGALAFFEPKVQDALVAQGRPGYRFNSPELRAKWQREGQAQLATVGKFEFWA